MVPKFFFLEKLAVLEVGGGYISHIKLVWGTGNIYNVNFRQVHCRKVRLKFTLSTIQQSSIQMTPTMPPDARKKIKYLDGFRLPLLCMVEAEGC